MSKRGLFGGLVCRNLSTYTDETDRRRPTASRIGRRLNVMKGHVMERLSGILGILFMISLPVYLVDVKAGQAMTALWALGGLVCLGTTMLDKDLK